MPAAGGHVAFFCLVFFFVEKKNYFSVLGQGGLEPYKI